MTIFHFYADVSKLLIMIAVTPAITVIAIIMIQVSDLVHLLCCIPFQPETDAAPPARTHENVCLNFLWVFFRVVKG